MSILWGLENYFASDFSTFLWPDSGAFKPNPRPLSSCLLSACLALLTVCWYEGKAKFEKSWSKVSSAFLDDPRVKKGKGSQAQTMDHHEKFVPV